MPNLTTISRFLFVKLFSALRRPIPFCQTSSPFLSQRSFKIICDFEFYGQSLSSIPPFSILFVPLDLRFLVLDRLHSLNYPIILLTSGNDQPFCLPRNLVDEQPLISAWFVQNNCCLSSKCISIPIGLEDRWRMNHGNISDFNRLRRKLPSSPQPTILYSFSTSTNPTVRNTALKILDQHPNAVYHKSPDPWSYRRSLLNSMFVASPAGNGIDCHRTWEALYLNCIPVVVDPLFYNRFPSFPGLVLDCWGDLLSYTTSDLSSIYQHRLSMLIHYSPLWLPYWIDLIHSIHSNSSPNHG